MQLKQIAVKPVHFVVPWTGPGKPPERNVALDKAKAKEADKRRRAVRHALEDRRKEKEIESWMTLI